MGVLAISVAMKRGTGGSAILGDVESSTPLNPLQKNTAKKARKEDSSSSNNNNMYITPPNMNKIMGEMRELETNSIINGFSIDTMDMQLLDDVTSGSSNPSSVFRELFNDMLGEARPRALNAYECFQCHRIYNNSASIKISTREFKGKLFETPFDVAVVSRGSKDVIGKVTQAVKEKLIESYWMPFLIDHYDWIKTFGLCPFYFEPVILTQNFKPAVFYVPVCPKPEMGTIYVYQRKNRSQGYLWRWSSSASPIGGDLSVGGMSSPTDIPPPKSFKQTSALSVASNTNSSKIFGAGPVSMPFENVGNSSSSEASRSNGRVISGSRSRYMFFSVRKPPMLNGYLSSDIKSIMNEIISLEKMEALEIAAAQKQLNPPIVVEFSPDPVKMTQGDDTDNNRLRLETDLKLLFHHDNSYYRDDAFGNSLRGNIQNNEIMQRDTDKDSHGMGAMQRVMQFQNKLQSPINYPEIPLGLTDPSNYDDYKLLQLNSSNGGNNSSTELERLLLYVKNNPGSNIAETISSMGKNQLKGPPNATYLQPFHKISSGTPKISMPKFSIEETKQRVDKLAASVVDYPLELIMNRTGHQSSHETASQFLKERLNCESKYYETLVKHLWWMASSPILSSTREMVDSIREQKEEKKNKSKEKKINPETNEKEQRQPDLSKKHKNVIHTFTPDDIEQWNNIEISFPKTPFLDLETLLTLYEVGMVDDSRIMNYLSTIYNVPNDGDMSRVKKKLTEFFKRKYGESNIELQTAKAKEDKSKETPNPNSE